MADAALFPVSYQQCSLPRDRASPATLAVEPSRDARSTAGHAGAGAADGGPAPRGGCTTVGRPSLAASARAVSIPDALTPAPEAEDTGGTGGLVAGRDGTTAGAGGVGRPALG